MKSEIKARWVEALRSGKYRQGKTTLYSPYTRKFCCLGVLCHVALGVSRNDLPDTPYELFNGPILSEKQVKKLYGMNDGINGPEASFPEIADWIEANIETTN